MPAAYMLADVVVSTGGARQGFSQKRLIGREDRLHIRCGDAALIAIHQRVIRRHAKR